MKGKKKEREKGMNPRKTATKSKSKACHRITQLNHNNRHVKNLLDELSSKAVSPGLLGYNSECLVLVTNKTNVELK